MLRSQGETDRANNGAPRAMVGNFAAVLAMHAAQAGDRTAFAFGGEGAEEALSYAGLAQRAAAIGDALRAAGAAGTAVPLLFAPGLDFVAALFGCFWAGAIAVPLYPPRVARGGLDRFKAILDDCGAVAVLAQRKLHDMVAPSLAGRALRWIIADDLRDATSTLAPPDGGGAALIQYTSGSTSLPKGVLLSHANLLHNSSLIESAYATGRETSGVIWLPPYHDMGLIGGILQPLYCGGRSALMPPMAFLQSPFRWLDTISRTGADVSGGPDFAYDLCTRKITDEQRDTLDLGRWRLAFTGAERVRPETLDRFSERFAPAGFRRDAFCPCYGLAESTLMVTSRRAGAAVRTERLDADAPRLVSCGPPAPGVEVAIVDPDSLARCPAGRVGEVCVASASVAQGYWRREAESARAFGVELPGRTGGWLRTGDLGFLRDGELYVCGRRKDLIIVRGRNHYPDDIEAAIATAIPRIAVSRTAAIGIERDGREGVAVIAELERSARGQDPDQIVDAIRAALSEQLELRADRIVVIEPGSIPTTTSGKVQRHRCGELLHSGGLRVAHIWSGQPPATPATACSPIATEHSAARADDLIGWLRDYGERRINSRLADERRSIAPHVVLDFGNRGILGMEVPESHGGIALSIGDGLRVSEQLAAIDLTLAAFVGVHNILGIRPILQFAAAPARDDWLPRLARGRELAGFAITEPAAGSNPRAMRTQAIAQDGGWLLNGQKAWIGNGAWAGVLNVFARDPGSAGEGISGFLVPQDRAGLRQGAEALTMGMRGMVQNMVHLDDVAVTRADLLGQAGHGLAVAQDAMLFGRLGIGAFSVGAMKRCAQLMLRYASRRDIGTGRLLDNPVTQLRLSRLGAAIEATEALVHRIAALADAGTPPPPGAFAACKFAGPEFLWEAADGLVQLLGGRGYVEPNAAPQLLRDARLLRIFEGPSETMAMFLGSSVLEAGEDVGGVFGGVIEDPAIRRRLAAAAGEIADRPGVFADPIAARRWAAARIGMLATWAALWGACGAQRRRGAAWVEREFERCRRAALERGPSESVLLDSAAIETLVASYAASIGDVEQAGAGEDHALDPLLRRASTAEPPRRAAAPPVADATVIPSEGMIVDRLRAGLAATLRVPAARLDARAPMHSLGIDSLAAVEFKHAIEEEFGVALPITRFLEGASLADLAADIAAAPAAPPIQLPADVAPKEGGGALSAGQRALWFIHQLAPVNSAYNVALLFDVAGRLDAVLLRQSLQHVVDRHGALRTTFVADPEGEPRAHVHPHAASALVVEDLGALDEIALDARLKAEMHRPFDLAQGPLLRAFLFDRGAGQLLGLVLHHIIEDSWSLGVIVGELRRAYAALAAGRTPDLPPVRSQYSDYVDWQGALAAGPEGERLWAYWRDRLAGPLPILALRTDRPRPALQTYRGDTLAVPLPADLVAALRTLSADHRTTLYVTLLAGLFALLHRHSGQDDIVIGSPMLGRGRPEFRDVVGYCTNPVALRARMTGDASFAALVSAVKEAVVGALAHQDLPFPTLVERLRPPRDPSRSPLFDVLFSVQKDLPENLGLGVDGAPDAVLDFGAARLAKRTGEEGFAQFDLALQIIDAGETLEARFQFNSDLFDRSTIARLADHYRRLLADAAGTPERRLDALALIGEQERDAIVRWSGVAPAPSAPIGCSLFYFAASDGNAADKYRLLIEGARFADAHGFEAVWTPERHFDRFGGLYPNPSVTGAALAMVTRRLRIRAGSVVLPLHHPMRVAEEWSVVDNLSGGRVDLAFATGWNPRDFALAAGPHGDRKAAFDRGLEMVRSAWRGDKQRLGESEVVLHPRPIQREFNCWIACSGAPESFAAAGARGANVLTGLMMQTPEALAANIRAYRDARARAGHDAGRVTLMLHSFVGTDAETVREAVREPFLAYLRASVELWRGASINLDTLSDAQRQDLLDYSFERYWRTAALFGTPENCAARVRELAALGVDEIACLIDFGLPVETALAALPRLDEVRRLAQPKAAAGAEPVDRQFAARAGATPGAIAVVGATESLTYAELDRRADRLAEALGAHGIGPGDAVAMLLGRSPALVVTLLAIFRAGAAVVPLDPRHPADRLRRIVRDSGAACLVSEQSTQALAATLGIATIAHDASSAGPVAAPDRHPDDLAYILYTSGSTGEPKGVEVSHRALAERLRAFAAQFSLGVRDVLLAVTTPAFDIAMLELLLPLVGGGRVVIAGEDETGDGVLLAAALARHGATVMQATPATWRLLLASGWAGDPALRVLCGGEALAPDLARRLAATGAPCWNLYGPTEATIWATAHRLVGAEDPVPIGRPIAGITCHVLDAQLEPVPIGLAGELYLGGEGLARGYRGLPELTAERFPIHPRSVGRLYRTGDRASWNADGTLAFLGRDDAQIKLRGHRIELGEIEAALAAHSDVREAAAALLAADTPESRLAAWFVPANGRAPDPAELRRFVGERLPAYMIPSSIEPIAALPLTGNGKLDRRALAARSPACRVPAGAPAQSAIERGIAAIWRELLQLPEVAAGDNFFDLGGHSLQLARVQARLRSDLAIDLPMVELYRHPTIAALARRIEGSTGDRTAPQERADHRRDALHRRRERRDRQAAE